MKVIAVLALAAVGCASTSNSEKIAVGSWSEMDEIIGPARACGAMSVRADPLDDNLAVFVTYDASEQASDCVRDWVRAHLPHTEATERRWRELGFDV